MPPGVFVFCVPLRTALGTARGARPHTNDPTHPALTAQRAAKRAARSTIKVDRPALRTTRAHNLLRRKWNLVTLCRLCDTAVSNVRAACYALQPTVSEKITWPVLIAALMILCP